MNPKQKFLKKAISTAEALLDAKNFNAGQYNITKYVVLHFYVKAIKLVKGISMLCKVGLFSDAKILFRPLFEIAYYCEYILIDLNSVEAAENILALAAVEDKTTEDYIDKNGGIDIDKMDLNDNEKSIFKQKAINHSKNRVNNYNFVIERLRKRSSKYTNLSDEKILAMEGIKNKSFLNKVNEIFDKEEKGKNLWKKYKTILRDCSKSIHALDFGVNVNKEDKELHFRTVEREETGEMILGGATNFLIRIMDITNDVFELKADGKIKKLFDEAKKM